MSTLKQQQPRRRINTNTTHQSRNTNAYIDRDEYHRRSLLNQNHYWNHDYHRSNDDFYLNEYYQYRNSYTSPFQHIRKGRQTKNEQQYNCKSSSSSNNNHALYYENIPPRHRHQQQQQQHSDIREQRLSRVVQEFNVINKTEQMEFSNSSNNDEQPTKPLQSVSSSSTISEITHNVESTNRKELHAKNLAVAAMAARQQSAQPQTNLGVVQTLMNSLILQQQQQQQPVQAQSTVQLQYQLTNALLATMIQQRVKESVLQAQAQQIQAALPTLLAAQALVYQQQQQQQQGQITATLPPHVAHPGTKFNNRPLVKFAVARPTISSLPSGSHIQQSSTTTLPTYQQIQEIERGISLDQAIHLKSAIDIGSVNNGCIPVEGESIGITNSHTIE